MDLKNNQIFLYQEIPENNWFAREYAITSTELKLNSNLDFGRIKGKNISNLVDEFLVINPIKDVEILINPIYRGDFQTDGTGAKPFYYSEKGVSEKVAKKFVNVFQEKGILADYKIHSVSLRYLIE